MQYQRLQAMYDAARRRGISSEPSGSAFVLFQLVIPEPRPPIVKRKSSEQNDRLLVEESSKAQKAKKPTTEPVEVTSNYWARNQEGC